MCVCVCVCLFCMQTLQWSRSLEVKSGIVFNLIALRYVRACVRACVRVCVCMCVLHALNLENIHI